MSRRFGNKYWEDLDEIPGRHRWVEYSKVRFQMHYKLKNVPVSQSHRTAVSTTLTALKSRQNGPYGSITVSGYLRL